MHLTCIVLTVHYILLTVHGRAVVYDTVEQCEHCLACMSNNAGHVVPTKLKRIHIQSSTHVYQAHIVTTQSARTCTCRFRDLLPHIIQACNRNVTTSRKLNHSRLFLSTHGRRRIPVLGQTSAYVDSVQGKVVPLHLLSSPHVERHYVPETKIFRYGEFACFHLGVGLFLRIFQFGHGLPAHSCTCLQAVTIFRTAPPTRQLVTKNSTTLATHLHTHNHGTIVAC